MTQPLRQLHNKNGKLVFPASVDSKYIVVEAFGKLGLNQQFVIVGWGRNKGQPTWTCKTLHDNCVKFVMFKSTMYEAIINCQVNYKGLV